MVITTAEGASMSAPAGRQIGEAFNPFKRFNGVFIPLGLLTHPGLSDRAKLFYGRLCLYSGKEGSCFAGRTTMAKDMGVNVATITRLLNELTRARFIRRKRRGPHHSDAIEFLYHPAFVQSEKTPIDVAEMRDQDTEDVTEVQHQGDGMMSQICTLDVANPAPDDVANSDGPIRKTRFTSDKIHKQDSSSSSREVSENNKRRREEIAEKRKKISLSSDGPKPKTGEAAWHKTGDAMEQAATIIRESTDHRGFSVLGRLEVHTVLAIVKHMLDLEDLKLWLGTAPVFHATAKSWGRIVTDAAHWPARRCLTGTLVERAVPLAEPVSSYYEQPAAEAQPQAAEHKPEPVCAFCGRTGVREAANDKTLWEWCACIYGDAARQKHPGHVNECNERVAKLRNRFGVPNPNAETAAV